MTVTNYLWDDENITLEYDDADTTVAEYTYEPELYGNLISERRDGETYQHHYDALGSTRMLTDTSGQITDTFEYDAWGNDLSRTGATETPFQWVGEIGYHYDVELDSYYVRTRAITPTIARWKSVDPIEWTDAANRYWYAVNSPMTISDPSGLAPPDLIDFPVFNGGGAFPKIPAITFTLLPFSNNICGGFKTAWRIDAPKNTATHLFVSELCYNCVAYECDVDPDGCCMIKGRKSDVTSNCAYEVRKVPVSRQFIDYNSNDAYSKPISAKCCSDQGYVWVSNNIRLFDHAALNSLPLRQRDAYQRWNAGLVPGFIFKRCGQDSPMGQGTTEQPPFWNNRSVISAAGYRSWRIRWNCCTNPAWQEFETWPDDKTLLTERPRIFPNRVEIPCK